MRLLNGPALDGVEILQRDSRGVIDESPPLAPGAEERTKPALVIPDVQVAVIGQKAVGEHASGSAIVADITNVLALMGKVTEALGVIVCLWWQEFRCFAANLSDTLRVVEPVQAQACGVGDPASGQGCGDSGFSLVRKLADHWESFMFGL